MMTVSCVDLFTDVSQHLPGRITSRPTFKLTTRTVLSPTYAITSRAAGRSVASMI